MQRLAALLLGLAVLAACTEGGESADEARPESEESTTTTSGDPAPPVTVDDWIGDDLPLVASPVSVSGGIGVYFAEINRSLWLVGVELADGTEEWRKPVHQHGRIRGVVFPPYVDDDLDAVVATAFEDGRIQLRAHAIGTGEEIWRAATEWAELTPRRCLDRTMLCLPLNDGRRAIHDPETGELVEVVDGGLERTIGGAGDLRLSAEPAGGDVELGRFTSEGYEVVWRRPLSDFVPAEQAALYGPNGGWNAAVDDDTGRALFLVGSLPPEGADDLTNDQIAELVARGSLVALADPDGSPVFGVTGVRSCGDLPFSTDVFWTCGEPSTVFEEDYDDDGELDPNAVYGQLIRRSFSDPADALTVDLDDPVSPFEGIEATSDDDLFVLRPFERAPKLLDAVSGDLVEPEGEVLVGCELDGEEDAAFVTLRTYDGDEADYLTTYDPRGVCDLEGEVVDPVAHFRAGNPVPEWFGLARATDPDASEYGGLVDGTILWAGVDRVLRGATIAD